MLKLACEFDRVDRNSGERAFVAAKSVGLDDSCIGGNVISDRKQNYIAGNNVGGGNRRRLSVSDDCGGGGRNKL